MLSHLKFIIMQMKWDYRDNDLFHRTFTGTDAAFWEQWGPVLVDNYMLRYVPVSERMSGCAVAHWMQFSRGPCMALLQRGPCDKRHAAVGVNRWI